MRQLGFDINHWKNPVPIKALVDEGAKYIIGKVTDGISYSQVYINMYNSWKKDTQELGIPFGSFHYWRVTKDAHRQADFYRAKSGLTDFPPIYDVEKYFNLGFYSRYENARRLRKSIERTKINFDVERLIIYTSYYHWLELTGNADFTDCDLWIANYGRITPLVAKPWTEWVMWQYTKAYKLNGKHYDGNWSNGDISNLLIKKPVVVLTLEQRVALLEEKVQRLEIN